MNKRLSFLLCLLAFVLLSIPTQAGKRFIAWSAAVVSGCTISDDFSSTLANWSTSSMRGTWTNNETAGAFTVTGLDATDGDAGIVYSGCTTTYLNQWAEVKMTTFPVNAGDQGGPMFRVSTNKIGTPASGAWGEWMGWINSDGQFVPQKITNDVYCCSMGGVNLTTTFSTNHYLGVECINNRTNLIWRIYDNGTTSVPWVNGWTALIGEIQGVAGNTTIAQTEGNYVGLWYGDGGGTKDVPASRFDDFKAGSFDAYAIDTFSHFTNNTSPVTASYTVSATSTLLLLGISCANGATVRAGGAPTYNSVAMTQAGSTQKAATSPEGSVELWYLISPTTGSSQTISIPNTGSAPVYAEASSWVCPGGRTAVLDLATGSNGTSANPSVSITNTVVGGLIYSTMFCGRDTAPTAQAGVSLNRTDEGAFSDSNQYTILGQPRASTNNWTVASDDWGMVVAAFK